MDAMHYNNYCIKKCNLFQHSKIAQEPKVSTFCMFSIIILTVVLAVVYIPAVVYVTKTS